LNPVKVCWSFLYFGDIFGRCCQRNW
jgi:hypothetical protein